MKQETFSWEYNWTSLSLEVHKHTGIAFQVWGLDVVLTTLLSEENIRIAKSKVVQTGWSNVQMDKSGRIF
jgi:hypothetical protein